MFNSLKKFNLRDWLLYNVITVFMTEKEWHSYWRGFFAGISFSQEGTFARKLGQMCGVKHHKTDIKARDFEAGYSTGELLARVTIAVALVLVADKTGACQQVISSLF